MTQKYAVLVGIDRYDDITTPKLSSNLAGCVNDVDAISKILENDLHIPSTHITKLVAPNDQAITNFSAPGVPTRKNLLEALTLLLAKPKGAFVYFHYSGHGGRYATRYPNLKGKAAHDEVLCTRVGKTTDVELGRILENLGQRHAVCVVLDCCHSGGGDRTDAEGDDEGEKIRVLNLYQREASEGEEEDNNDDHQEEEEGPEYEDEMYPESEINSTGMRDGDLRDSYLYRPRHYNLFAAAEPHQFAKENYYCDTNGKIVKNGVLTRYLLELLPLLLQSSYPVTCGELQHTIDVKVKARVGKQDLSHLGNPNRSLFGSRCIAARPSKLLVSVASVNMGFVTINRGWAHNVAVDDEFLVFPPENIAYGLTKHPPRA
jgi:hypothetical protein